MYASTLFSATSTIKPESAGLLAHIFSVLQLAKDLGGSQWLCYDRSFSKWAAAKTKNKDLGRTKLADPTTRVGSKRQFCLRDLGMSGMEL